MKKYSGGYSFVNPNFVISDITTKQPIDEELLGVIAVTKNILFRGVPTKPSVYLSQVLGNVESDKFQYTYGTRENEWDSIIKGGENDNPALDAYKLLCETEPQIASLTLPECLFCDIIKSNPNSNEQADFYFPFSKTEIEIDGWQHSTTKKSDADRDQRFKKVGVAVKRFSTQEIRKNLNEVVKSIALKVTAALDTDTLFVESKSLSDNTKLYMMIFRFQVLLLELLKSGILDLNAPQLNLNICSEESPVLIDKAFPPPPPHLKLWISNLFALLNKSISFPNISTKHETGYRIDIDLYNRYDQNIYAEDGTIRIRNDYFMYCRNPYRDSNTYCQCKNYYSVENHSLRFNRVSQEDQLHRGALSFFLKNIFFGKDAKFRNNQSEIVSAGLSNENSVIGLLPTGSGKSVCYQLIGMLTPGVSLVISPLKLLMKDQCDNLASRFSITNAIFINSDNRIDKELFERGKAKFIYISPERFLSQGFQEIFPKQAKQIAHVAIDEVHCLSEWGHDFRTSYLLLIGFIKKYIELDSLLLTGTSATASTHVIQDITVEFERVKSRNKPILIRSSSVIRPELLFLVKNCSGEDQKKAYLVSAIKKNITNTQKTLVFAPTKTNNSMSVEEICNTFDTNSITSYGKYTGGAEDKKYTATAKEKAFEDFKSGKTLTMVATKAFGMGVDIVDIRHTIHYGVSSSVEAMYQEVGRAGRDGKPSTCTFLICKDDKTSQKIENLLSSKNDDNFVTSLLTSSPNLYGDLSTQLYLLQNNTCEPPFFTQFIIKTYCFIRDHPEFNIKEAFSNIIEELLGHQAFAKYEKKFYHIEKSSRATQSKYEDPLQTNSKDKEPTYKTFTQLFDKALYKLYILGLIPLWSVQYKETGKDEDIIYNVEIIKDPSLDNCVSKLQDYINRYETFTFTPDASQKQMKAIIKQLCEWDNRHFLVYRKDSLRNMYTFLLEFKDSDDFSQRIQNYFVDNPKLQEFINDRDLFDCVKVFDCLKTEPRLLQDQLRRPLEGTKDNWSCNFMFGMAGLQTGNFSSDSEERLKRAYDRIMRGSMDVEDAKDVLERSIDYVQKNKKACVTFFKFLYQNYSSDCEKMHNCRLKSKKIKNKMDEIADHIEYERLQVALSNLKKSIGEFYE